MLSSVLQNLVWTSILIFSFLIFRCKDGNCINSTLICDTQRDCPDASDELQCCNKDTQFQCVVTRECVDKIRTCDGQSNYYYYYLRLKPDNFANFPGNGSLFNFSGFLFFSGSAFFRDRFSGSGFSQIFDRQPVFQRKRKSFPGPFFQLFRLFRFSFSQIFDRKPVFQQTRKSVPFLLVVFSVFFRFFRFRGPFFHFFPVFLFMLCLFLILGDCKDGSDESIPACSAKDRLEHKNELSGGIISLIVIVTVLSVMSLIGGLVFVM